MRIGHIELFAADPGRSQKLYPEAPGHVLVSDQGAAVWIKPGDVEFLPRSDTDAQENREDSNRVSIGIVLYTNNLHRTIKELEFLGLMFRERTGRGARPSPIRTVTGSSLSIPPAIFGRHALEATR